MLEHTALVKRERESLESIGYNVYTENQNLFRLRGQTSTIAGKPDLIGEKHHEILISDAKTGRPSPSHQTQVRIYQYAVPKTLPQFRAKDPDARSATPSCTSAARPPRSVPSS